MQPNFILALFNTPADATWKDHKRFAIQALKSTGFGTPKSEEKIVVLMLCVTMSFDN